MKQNLIFISLLFMLSYSALPAKTSCNDKGVWLQVLGSGGPELDDQRASSGYLIWQDGHARVLVDMGAGSLLRFEQSGAVLSDLDIVLLSHLHVDHTNDLPALVKASFFTARKRDLLLYGPTGNQLMPSASEFVQALFGVHGAFRYLSGYLDGAEAFRLQAFDINASDKKIQALNISLPYRVSAVAVHHGPIPSLAWRVDMDGKSIVFSGDMNNDYATLALLAKDAGLLVAHHAVPEPASGVARNLHMPPSVIGKIASAAKVKQLVLSHRMQRTLGKEKNATRLIRQSFTGLLHFTDDLQCFRP